MSSLNFIEIFTNTGRRAEQKDHNFWIYTLVSYAPLLNFVSSSFCDKSCPLYDLKNVKYIFMKLRRNSNRNWMKVQSAKRVALGFVFF